MPIRKGASKYSMGGVFVWGEEPRTVLRLTNTDWKIREGNLNLRWPPNCGLLVVFFLAHRAEFGRRVEIGVVCLEVGFVRIGG